MADDTEDATAPESQAMAQDVQKDNQLRATIADAYTFVRSREINKTIAAFTFDHYIDEAKNAIKADRVLRTASDPDKGRGTRSSQLQALQKLQTDFGNAYTQAKTNAQSRDSSGS